MTDRNRILSAKLARLRYFILYRKQLEPDTAVPDELIFGPEPGRVAPHIYPEEEIVELLAAAPCSGHAADSLPAHPRNPVKSLSDISDKKAGQITMFAHLIFVHHQIRNHRIGVWRIEALLPNNLFRLRSTRPAQR